MRDNWIFVQLFYFPYPSASIGAPRKASAPEIWPGRLSIFGRPLWVGKPLVSVYTDEAGTSVNEPVAVVVGIVLRPDTHYRAAEQYLISLRDRYLPGAPKSFVFHAKHLLPRKPDDFAVHGIDQPVHPNARRRLLRLLVAAPRKLGMGVVWGYCRRRSDVEMPKESEADARHIQAYTLCLKSAADFIATHHRGELGTVISADDKDRRKHLKKVLGYLKEDANKPDNFYSGTPADVILDTVHFTEYDGSPILQYADAAAFALRSYLSEWRHGSWLGRALTPSDLPGTGDLAGHGFIWGHRIS